MRITSFISGAAVGILAGMYVADRRSLTNLQNKLQVMGNVVQDVVGKAKNNVMGGATSHIPVALHDMKTSGHDLKTSVSNLDHVKELIDHHPEVKRKVNEILQENGLAQRSSNLTKSKSATTTTSTSNATKDRVDQHFKPPADEHQSTH